MLETLRTLEGLLSAKANLESSITTLEGQLNDLKRYTFEELVVQLRQSYLAMVSEVTRNHLQVVLGSPVTACIQEEGLVAHIQTCKAEITLCWEGDDLRWTIIPVGGGLQKTGCLSPVVPFIVAKCLETLLSRTAPWV